MIRLFQHFSAKRPDLKSLVQLTQKWEMMDSIYDKFKMKCNLKKKIQEGIIFQWQEKKAMKISLLQHFLLKNL